MRNADPWDVDCLSLSLCVLSLRVFPFGIGISPIADSLALIKSRFI